MPRTRRKATLTPGGALFDHRDPLPDPPSPARPGADSVIPARFAQRYSLPAAPLAPVHRIDFDHLDGIRRRLVVFVVHFLLLTELLVRLVLFRAADIGLVVREIRQDVIEFPRT